MNDKKSKILKVIVFIAVILLLAILTIELLPIFKNLATSEGRLEFKNTLEDMGVSGVFAILGLMIAQVLLAFIPGEPVQILAGMCYGSIGGAIIILVGAFLSTVLAFFAVRKFGRSFIYTFVSKERIEKLEKSKWFKNPKRLEIIFLILFLLPAMPKDLLVYIGGLLPVNPLRFILISTFARFPAIIASTMIGNHILEGNWGVIVGVCVITVAATVLVFLSMNKKDKKMVQEMLEK